MALSESSLHTLIGHKLFREGPLLSTLLQESPTGKLLKSIYEGNFEKILKAIENNAILNVGNYNALSVALERYNFTKFGTQLALDKLAFKIIIISN